MGERVEWLIGWLDPRGRMTVHTIYPTRAMARAALKDLGYKPALIKRTITEEDVTDAE